MIIHHLQNDVKTKFHNFSIKIFTLISLSIAMAFSKLQ